MLIRKEAELDRQDIRLITKQAFGGTLEANLIDELRESGSFIPELSLVFEQENKIVGHIMFSPVKIKAFKPEKQEQADSKKYLALAPLSVFPTCQKQGVGTSLVNYGIDLAKEMEYDAVIVLGPPGYYQRFGFKPGYNWDIFPPFEVQDKESFMAIELTLSALVPGIIEYAPQFDILTDNEFIFPQKAEE